MAKKTSHMYKVKRIAITGPESTGKSWLSENLAYKFKCSWVPEYARIYLEKLDRPYTYDDILEIAKGQIAGESSALLKSDRILFSDTECLVTKIWCDVKYGKCHEWILRQLSENPHDLYLLCDTDLPWEPDPLREHPHRRKFLFDLYADELIKRKLPFKVISGTGDARLKSAAEAINKWLYV
jgi:NadR type nicotinamide-nucleotide adenylyltransferase